MDFSALLIETVAPYLRGIVFVVGVTWAAGKFLPPLKQVNGKRTDGQKFALMALALLAGIAAAFVGMIREDASVGAKFGDGFIVWALATANRDAVMRAVGMSKKRGAA